MRVALLRSPVTFQATARAIRPPSSGKAGIRLKNSTSTLISASQATIASGPEMSASESSLTAAQNSSGPAAAIQVGRRPLRASPYNVNWLTTKFGIREINLIAQDLTAFGTDRGMFESNYPAERIVHMLTDSGVAVGVTVSAERSRLPDSIPWLLLDDAEFHTRCAALPASVITDDEQRILHRQALREVLAQHAEDESPRFRIRLRPPLCAVGGGHLGDDACVTGCT